MGASVARLQTLRGIGGWRCCAQGPTPRLSPPPPALPDARRLPGRARLAACWTPPRLPARAPRPCPGSLGPWRARGLRVLGAGLPGRPRGLRAQFGAPCGAQPWARAHHSGARSPPDTAPFLPGAGAGAGALGAPHPRARGTTWERASGSEGEGRGEDVLRIPPAPAPAKACSLYFFFWLRVVFALTPSPEPTGRCGSLSIYYRGRGGGDAAGSVGGPGGGWGAGPRGVSRPQLWPGAGCADCVNPSAPAGLGRASTADPSLSFGPNLRNLGWGFLNLAGAVLASRIHKVVVWILLLIGFFFSPLFGQLWGGNGFMCSYPMRFGRDLPLDQLPHPGRVALTVF